MSIDKLYCYDSMHNDNVTISISGSPLTIDLSSIQSASGNSMTLNSVTTGTTGVSGVYTINNTGSTITNGTAYPWVGITHDNIINGGSAHRPVSIKGDAEIGGELTVGGKNIGESLDRIEKRLAILRPNAELEERWEKLRELGEEYRKLEKDILEKEHIYDILKK